VSDAECTVSDQRSQAATTALLRFYHEQLDRPIDDHIGACSHPECEEYRDIEDDDDPRALDDNECSRPSTAREYFADVRGYTDETIDRYCFGWAPPWGENLETELVDELCVGAGFTEEELAATGLFFPNLKRPKWEGRYVLPYFDADHNQPIYGIARCTGKKGGGHPKAGYHGHPADRYHKYDKHMKNPEFVNSPDEPIFGIDSIEDGEPLLIAGGIADAITLQQAGYPCVSPVTTVRFKGPDLRKFVRLAWDRDIPRVYIVNDAEPPTSEVKELPNEDEDTEFDRIGRKVNIRPNGEGRRAAIDNARDFLGANIPTYLVDLPQPASVKVDPDDAVVGGLGNVGAMLASATPADQNAEYQKRVAEDTTTTGRHSAADGTNGPAGRTGAGTGPDATSDGEGPALYGVVLTDLDTVGLTAGARGDNPFGHHGNSHGYFEVDSDGEIGYDYKYKATYNGLNGIFVEAGERDAANPEGELSFRETLAAWHHAKEHGYIPDDGPIPLKALWQVAVASDDTEFEADDWIWRAAIDEDADADAIDDLEVGMTVGTSDERYREVDDRLPDGVHPRFGTAKGAYDAALSLLDEQDIDHGRERTNFESSEDALTWDQLPYYNMYGNVDTRPTRRDAAAILLDNHEFAAPMPQGNAVTKTPLYHYYEPEGFFEREGAGWVHRHVGRKVPELETADMKEIVNRVKRASFVDRDAFDAGDYEAALINLGNGVYDLDEEELIDHSPDYLFRTSIPQTYDPDAECPNITEFIEEIVPGDQERRTLFEWIGFCLEVGYPIHRFLVLYGDGRNGKSRYFELIREFLASDNVSGVTLDTIASGGFGVAALDENLLNVDTESADTRLSPGELNRLKALTGGDQRQVDVKYESPFEMTNTAKLAFAANNPPRFQEQTDAIADRLLTIELPYRFANDENADKEPIPERQLMRRLTTDEELSGLLNKALAGLQRVRERGYFSIEEGTTSRERFEEYQAEADSIVGFAHHCLTNEGAFALPKTAVYNAYKSYCEDNGHTPAEKNAFFRQLGRKAGVETHTKQPAIRRDDGETWRPRVLDHLWITSDGLPFLSHGAREDTLTTIQHMHKANADYAHDLLLRTRTDADATDTADAVSQRTDGGSGDVPQDERMAIVTDVIGDLEDDEPADRATIINAVLDAGIEQRDGEKALDDLSSNGEIYQPPDAPLGKYRLNN
jgi:P4 family phage/plasmid primase-like protien